MHLHRFANLLLIDGVRLEGEHRRISHKHLHRPGASLRALRVVRRAGVSTLMILVHPCKEQGAIVHHHDILRLIRLEQSFVLCPCHVLKGGICFYVTMNHTGQTKRQVLHRRSERDLRWIWNSEDLIKIYWQTFVSHNGANTAILTNENIYHIYQKLEAFYANFYGIVIKTLVFVVIFFFWKIFNRSYCM